EIVREEKIDCEFERVDGFLFVPPGESTELLDRELDAIHRAGLAEVERVARAPIETFGTGPALRFPRQAQFHPVKYLSALVKAIESRGGRLFGRTRAHTITGGTPGAV